MNNVSIAKYEIRMWKEDDEVGESFTIRILKSPSRG